MSPEEIRKEQEEIENETLKEADLLLEGRMTDYAIIVAIGVRFARPFKKWPAFKEGIIDQNGKVLKSPKGSKEKKAFTPLDNVILRIKKLIPSRLWYLLGAAYIFKGFYLRESYGELKTEQEIIEEMNKFDELKETKDKVKKMISENSRFSEDEFWKYYLGEINE